MHILGINIYCTGQGLNEAGLGVLEDFRLRPSPEINTGPDGIYIFEAGRLRQRLTQSVEFYKAPVLNGSRSGTAFLAITSLRDSIERQGLAGSCVIVPNDPGPDVPRIKALLHDILRDLVSGPDGDIVRSFNKTKLRAQAGLFSSPSETKAAYAPYFEIAIKNYNLNFVQPSGYFRFTAYPTLESVQTFEELRNNKESSARDSKPLSQEAKAELMHRVDRALSQPKAPVFQEQLVALLSRFER